MNYARVINFILGLWLFFAPWALGYTAFDARANDHWAGIGVMVVALVAMTLPAVRFVNTAIGVWCVLAPFILGYTGAPLINDVVVGIAVILLSLVASAWETRARGRLPRIAT